MIDSLTLTPPSVDFAPLWHEWRGQEKARRFMPMIPATVAELAERLNRCAHTLTDADQPEYRWFILEGDIPVGTVGLSRMSSRLGHGEISFHLDERHHGSGKGGSAVGLLIGLIFKETSLHRLFATISEGNAASIALVERLGFLREAELRDHFRIEGRFINQLVYGLLRPEYDALPDVHAQPPGEVGPPRSH